MIQEYCIIIVTISTSNNHHPTIIWNANSIVHAQQYLYDFDWSSTFDIRCSPELVWLNFCEVLNECVFSFARIVYFRKPKAATLFHDINLKK